MRIKRGDMSHCHVTVEGERRGGRMGKSTKQWKIKYKGNDSAASNVNGTGETQLL